ncbi:hypothetical protein ACIBAI_26785 [Streptomyces sp. NPDC051041]|uniref:hypothetical protein n=1 Tax=Streptomyces sp. NPDC051041 TaxID=3365640 RepID=UPI0037969A0C
MTNQPYQGHDPYQQQPHQSQQPQAWPQQGYDEPHTQQWQGQTWETQTQPPVQAAETAYPPAQAYGEPRQTYQQPQQAYQQPQAYQQAYQQPQQGHPQPQPQQAYQQPRGPQESYGHQQPPYAEPQRYQQTHPTGAHHTSAPHFQPQAQPRPRRQPQPEPQPHTPPASPEAAPEYGPATLGGNARITDAQRARAEGRSPIIEPGMQPAALTALLGLLLAGTAAIGTYALLVPLAVLQAVTAAGWFRLNGMWPARQGIALGFAGALVADAALLVSGRSPAAILGTLGVWVLLSLVLHLRSHADPDERMYGLMATVAAAALAIVAGGYLAADADAVTVGAAAVAVAVPARALPLPTPASVVVALLAAAGAGIAVGATTGLGTPGALLGAGAAVCALIGHRVASYDYPSRFVHFTAGVALPLACAAPLVYVLGRALG